jgi:hypothetical protein
LDLYVSRLLNGSSTYAEVRDAETELLAAVASADRDELAALRRRADELAELHRPLTMGDATTDYRFATFHLVRPNDGRPMALRVLRDRAARDRLERMAEGMMDGRPEEVRPIARLYARVVLLRGVNDRAADELLTYAETLDKKFHRATVPMLKPYALQ